MESSVIKVTKLRKSRGWGADFSLNKGLYFLAIPIFLYFLIFCYLPMFGLVISFENYKPQLGVLGSKWVGFKNFADFFGGPNFLTILRNTLVISFLGLIVGFPASIIYALLLNEVGVKWFRKTAQTVHVLPYFVSMVVICGLIIEFCSTNGVVTDGLVTLLGIPRENLLQNPKYFWWINLVSDLWQGLGYGAIFFVSAIASVSQELHEAAAIDGVAASAGLGTSLCPVSCPPLSPCWCCAAGCSCRWAAIRSCFCITPAFMKRPMLFPPTFSAWVLKKCSTAIPRQWACSTPSWAPSCSLFPITSAGN